MSLSSLVVISFLLFFLKQTEATRSENFSELADATARIPPVHPAPATITAVLAMYAGHKCVSSELLILFGRAGHESCELAL
jgi:hypothetical protein